MSRLATCLLSLVFCSYAMNLYIMDLRIFVTNEEDRKQLKKLYNDGNKPRIQIRQELENIASRQPAAIRDLWEQIRTIKEEANAAVAAENLEKAVAFNIGPIYNMTQGLDSNIALSSNAAKDAKKKLVDSLDKPMKSTYKKFDHLYDKNDKQRYEEN